MSSKEHHTFDASCNLLLQSPSRDTYADREPDETANDRNDRAIRIATKWYDDHIRASQSSKDLERTGKTATRVILLTDDAGNRAKAEAEGILVASAAEYVKSLEDFPLLMDKLSHKSFDSEKQALPQYPPHLSMKELLEGLRQKKLLQGAFQASRENYLEGSVNVESFEKGVWNGKQFKVSLLTSSYSL